MSNRISLYVLAAALTPLTCVAAEGTKFIRQPGLRKQAPQGETVTQHSQSAATSNQGSHPAGAPSLGQAQPARLPSSPFASTVDTTKLPDSQTAVDTEATAYRGPASSLRSSRAATQDSNALRWASAGPVVPSHETSTGNNWVPKAELRSPHVPLEDSAANSVSFGDIIAMQREAVVGQSDSLQWSSGQVSPVGTSSHTPAEQNSAWQPQTRTSGVRSRPPSSLRVTSDYQSSMPNANAANAETLQSPDAEERQRRQQLAALVSHQIIQERPAVTDRPVQPLHPPAGWPAVQAKLGNHLQQCQRLLKKNGYFSAREEAEQAMAYLVQVLDGMSNRYHCEPSWSAARVAMKEAEDFENTALLSTDPQLLKNLIQSHETPALKTSSDASMARTTAAQRYRVYAKVCLLEAAQNHPWSSEVYYALGRSYQAQADAADGDPRALYWRAIVYYRAAISIDRSNLLTANNLGYCLLHVGLDSEAQSVLISAVNITPTKPLLENLSVASERVGDQTTRQWALSAIRSMDTGSQALPSMPRVESLTPAQFAALSPRSASPSVASVSTNATSPASDLRPGSNTQRYAPTPRLPGTARVPVQPASAGRVFP